MNLVLDQPWSLLALLLAIPMAWVAWRSVRSLGSAQTAGTLVLRLVVMTLLVLALARPGIAWRSDATALMVVMDSSASVPVALRTESALAVEDAIARRGTEDRVGVVTFAESAEVVTLAERTTPASLTHHMGGSAGTDIGAAIRMALATAPADAASRILLVSDGNSTSGDAMAAADLARAAGVPIDVLPLRYRHEHEVLFEQMSAPVRARIGQSIDLRMTLRSQGAASGRILLSQNGEPVDLDPLSDSLGFPVSLDPGANLVVLPGVPQGSGAQRFDAIFEPDDAATDAVPENNRGAAIVFVAGSGRVAIIEPEGTQEGASLADALHHAGIECERMPPERAMQGGLAALAGFDAVVLANVPRWAIDNAFDRAILAYTRDLGGGLLMLGGPESFGAGGWIGSETAKALPVKLDPPQTRMLWRSAVALVIDASGSMGSAVAATGTTQQEVANRAAVAGLRSMSRLDEACVIAFSGTPVLVAPLQQIGEGSRLEQSVMSIAPTGGTELFPAMEAASAQLATSRARTKHMIILTDGQTQGNREIGLALARRARAAGVSISTIGIGDGANDDLLKRLAYDGGGRFHGVKSEATARALPQIFIREVGMEGRALIEEGNFSPAVVAGLRGPLQGVDALPAMRGYVLSAPLGGLAQIGSTVPSPSGGDPIMAWMNFGVGRSISFASDLGARWTSAWPQWQGFQPFCEQSMRWVMRPPDDQSIQASIQVDGEFATVHAQLAEGSTLTPQAARVDARVVDPAGAVVPLAMRQVGPGRFVGTFRASRAGAYLTSIAIATARAEGAVRAGTTHAAVSVPYAAEFRSTQDDAALMRQIAQRTGGRVLALGQSASWDLFDRAGLHTSGTNRALWDLCALAAAVLMLFDVAWRRMAVNSLGLRGVLEHVSGGAVAAAGLATSRARSAPQAGGLGRLRAARKRATQGGGAAPASDASAAEASASGAAATDAAAPEGQSEDSGPGGRTP